MYIITYTHTYTHHTHTYIYTHIYKYGIYCSLCRSHSFILHAISGCLSHGHAMAIPTAASRKRRISERDCDDWFTGIFFDNRLLGLEMCRN